MYFYILDPRGDKEVKYFERIQGQLSNLLAENRVDGDMIRTTSIRTIDLLVDQAISADAKTIVVVGSDASLNRTINSLMHKDSDMVVGYIPMDPESGLGTILGMSSDIQTAVKAIAGRLIQELDLGRVGEHHFLSKVDLGNNSFVRLEPGVWGLKAARGLMQVRPFVVKLAIEGSFTATSEVLGAQIINSRNNQGCKIKIGDPSDGLLDILLLNKLPGSQIFRYRRELASGCLDNVPGSTVLHARKVEVLGPRRLPISVEGRTYTKAPAVIEAADKKIKMIVGKSRQF